MPYLFNFSVLINGQNINSDFITKLSVQQAFNEHTRFDLHVYSDREGDATMFTHEKAQDLLGADVTIALHSEPKDGADNTIKGIFTEFSFASDYSAAQSEIVLTGYGKTIALDGSPTNSSHLKKPVADVVKQMFSAAGLSAQVKTVLSDDVPFITQYGESNFNFIRRLAAEYGEPFYDDGTKIHFGKGSKGRELALKYPDHLGMCHLRVKLAPTDTEEHTYFSLTAKKEMASGKSVQAPGLDAFGKKALNESKALFKEAGRGLSPRKSMGKSGVDDAVRVAKQRAAGSLTVLEATSDSPYVQIGSIVAITAPGIAGLKYLVTSVRHEYDGSTYSNHFEAVPENLDVVPSPYYKKPLAEPQIGVVTANKDPDEKGRVQVKLLWQKDGETTPFIRVLRPDGGGSAPNRGFFFIPEIDDYVIVGFSQNDPDRPFVMGALPHGKHSAADKWGKKNDYRSISTRSGAIISFEDTDSKNEIRIQTDDTNYISILKESSDGTLKIYSSKAIEVNSGETIVVKSAKSIDVQGDKTINVKSESITVEATKTITMQANQKIELKAADVVIEGSKGFAAKGGATVKIEGAQVEVAGSAKASVKGNAQLELQGGAMASLKGAIVQIN